jgi:hypothetical protein
MPASEFVTYAGWAACLSAAASMGTLVTAILFFSRGQPWGTINDLVSALQLLFSLPLVPAIHSILAPYGQLASLLVACIGATGMLAAAALQTLLVLGRIDFRQQIRAVVVAGLAVGLWHLVSAAISLANGALPSAVVWLSVVAGLGYLATALGSSLWAAALGRALLSQVLP